MVAKLFVCVCVRRAPFFPSAHFCLTLFFHFGSSLHYTSFDAIYMIHSSRSQLYACVYIHKHSLDAYVCAWAMNTAFISTRNIIFCRRCFAFSFDKIHNVWYEMKETSTHLETHTHTHTLRLMKSRVRCIKYIHMRICIIVKKPQPDSILHSYSAPIDRSLKKYIQPTISTHYRDKEKKKPFWLLPIQCCVYVHKMGLNEVKSIDFRHRTCTKSIVSVIMLDDRSQNGVYNKFIRHFGRFYSLRSLFRVYTSIYWKHRVSRRRQL